MATVGAPKPPLSSAPLNDAGSGAGGANGS
jgi:hypothetical protein